MARSRVTGGKKLARKIRDLRKGAAALDDSAIEVGFFDPRIAAVAAQHEFGVKRGRTLLPERPAFRAGLEDAKAALVETIKAEGGRGKGLPDDAALDRGAEEVREAIRQSYLAAPGPELSEAQAARKAGTPGANKLLIGTEGPKMIDRIEARVVRKGG